MNIKQIMVASYPDELLHTWVEWNDTFLNNPCNGDSTMETLAGVDNSNARTRALEFHRLGLLKGRLTRTQSGLGGDRPHGLSLMGTNENPQSELGFIAYALGYRSNISEAEFRAMMPAFDSLCCVFLLNLGISYGDRQILYASIFDYILEQHQNHIEIPLTKEQQFCLAAGMFSTLYSDQAEELIDSFIADSPLDYLLYSNTKPPRRIAIPDFVAAFNTNLLDGTAYKPPRMHYYWIGTSGRPHGYFTRGYHSRSNFLRSIRKLEQESLKVGNNSPFSIVLSQEEHNVVADRLELISSVLTHYPELTTEWRNVMKSIYDGVLGSLASLQNRVGISTFPKIYYSHGVEPGADIEDQVFQIELTKPDELDKGIKMGDLLSTNGITGVIESIGEQDDGIILTVKKV